MKHFAIKFLVYFWTLLPFVCVQSKVCTVRNSVICGQEECNCVKVKGEERCELCDIWCERRERIFCNHGDCSHEGCKCHVCYSGASCEKYDNIYTPQFDREVYVAVVSPYARGVLRGIVASDFDDSDCAEKGVSICLCSYIIYRVFEPPESRALLKMNPDTGDLHFDVLEENVLEFIIAAYNFDANGHPDLRDNSIGYAKVIIHVTNSPPDGIETHLREMERVPNIYNWRIQSFEQRESEAHHLSKRAASNVPENTTAVLQPTGEWALATNATFTDTIPFILTISLPEGTNSISISITSATTIGGHPVYHFCDAVIDNLGTNLNILQQDNITFTMLSSLSNGINDGVNIELGNITNDASDTNDPATNDINIAFTATVLNPTDIDFSTTNYSVSALVYQNSYQLETTMDYPLLIHELDKSASFSTAVSFNGPSALPQGGSAFWDIALSVDAPVMNVTVDVFHSGNYSLKVCHVQHISIGAGFSCYKDTQIGITEENIGSSYDAYKLRFSQLINKNYKTLVPGPDYSVNFRVFAGIPSNAEIDHIYTLAMNVTSEVGTSAHTFNVTASNVAITQSTGVPKLMLAPNGTNIQRSTKHNITVTVTTNVNETDTYKAVIGNQQPSTCDVHFCGAYLQRTGSNVVCGLSVFEVSFRNTSKIGVHDEVTIDLGPVLNAGVTNVPEDNEVEIIVEMCYLECPALTIGDSFGITGRLMYGTSTITNSTDLVLVALGITNQVPGTNIIEKNGQSHIYYGGQAIYELQIEFPPLTSYTNLSVEIRTANAAKPSTSICSVYASGLDPLLQDCMAAIADPLYTPNPIEQSMNSEAKIAIGTVVNDAIQPVFVNITLVIVLLDDTYLDGDTMSTEVLLRYNNAVWNDTVTSTFASFSYGIQTYPVFNVTLFSASNLVRIGEAAIYELTITLPQNFVSKLFVEATAVDSEVKICRIYLSSRGDNIPCMADNDLYETKTAHTSGEGYANLVLDLHAITLTGRYKNEAANTITVRIAAALRNGFTYGAQQYLFTVNVWDEFSTPWSEDHGLFADSVTPFEATAPVLILESPATPADISKGSSSVVMATFYTSPKSSSSYVITVSVTSGCASICDIVFVSRGEYNPCIAEFNDVQFSSSDGNVTFDSAIFDLQEIVNIAPTGTTVVQDSNKVSLEVILSIPELTSCGSVTVDASLSYDGGSSSVSESINVGIISPQTLVKNGTYLRTTPPFKAPVFATIGEFVSWKVALHMPETTDAVQLTIAFPHSNNEAHLTAVNASIVHIGADFGCLSEDSIVTTLSTALGSTQMTHMQITFNEYLSNLGVNKRSQFRRPLPEDDALEIEFTFQVADHPDNIDGSVQNFDIVATTSDGRNVSVSDSVVISISGNEQAYVDFEISMDQFHHSERTSGDPITMLGNVTLLETSNAHASDVILHYMIPKYSVYTTLVNWTDVEPNITVTTDGTLEVHYPLIKFTDSPKFEINITIDANVEFESGMSDIKTVTPADLTYHSLQRADRLDNVLHFTDIKMVEFGFDSQECDSILGLETDPISDCQITSSSDQTSYQATDVQSGSVSAWSPSVRGQPFCGHEYVQLDFLVDMRIIGLSILSSADDALKYVTNFTIEYSSDGLLWKSVLDQKTGQAKRFNVSFNDATKTVSDLATIDLDPSEIFIASKIKLVPKDTNSGQECRPFIRMEAMGCQVQFNSSLTGTCPSVSSPTFPLNRRDYVVDEETGTIYVCMESEVGGDVICSRSTDDGTTWEEIEGIGNIIGVASNGSSVIGISRDGSSRMCSYDEGNTWLSCADDEFSETSSHLDYVTSKEIPFNDFQGDSQAVMLSSYGFVSSVGDVTGTMSGLSIQLSGSGTWDVIAQWGDTDWMAI